MARRLGLACALLHQPEFIILDEPTSGLDPIGARKVKDMLLELKDGGTSILLCSHLLSEVETVCDRIAILEHGRLLMEGSVSELLTRPDMLSILLKLTSDRDEEKLRELLRNADAQIVSITHPFLSLEELFIQIFGNKGKDAGGAGVNE